MEMIDRYWAVVQAHWTLVALAFGVLAFVGMVMWFQLSNRANKYDFIDVLMDFSGKVPRASLDNHITLFMALLAAWYIVVKTLYPAAGNVGADLVQILLVFLVYRLGRQGVQAWTNKAPTPPAQTGDNIGQQVVVPAAEAATDVGASVKSQSAIKTIKA